MKTMTRAEVRGLISEPIDVDKEIDSIAREACNWLGYTRLATDIAGRDRPLLRALAKLSIDPLDQRTVNRYRDRKIWQMGWLGAFEGPFSYFFIGLLSFVGAFFCAVVLPEIAAENHIAWGTAAHLLPIGVVLGALLGAAIGKVTTGNSFEWDGVPIREYRLPIPEFAIRKAIAVSRALPSAQLYVESIRQKPMADPFLVAVLGRERYYIEVWDEPKFEAAL